MQDNIEIFECEQRSDEWIRCRMGIPTASNFHKVLAGGEGKTRYEYLKQLACEIIWKVPHEGYQNDDMRRGIAIEPHLRNHYALETNTDLIRVGFVKCKLNVGYAGCSPDSFVGSDGLLEIKSCKPTILFDIMKSNRVPTEHTAQIQGQLWITGRTRCDVVIGSLGVDDLFCKTVGRDNAYIARLAIAVEAFNRDLEDEIAQHHRRKNA